MPINEPRGLARPAAWLRQTRSLLRARAPLAEAPTYIELPRSRLQPALPAGQRRRWLEASGRGLLRESAKVALETAAARCVGLPSRSTDPRRPQEHPLGRGLTGLNRRGWHVACVASFFRELKNYFFRAPVSAIPPISLDQYRTERRSQQLQAAFRRVSVSTR